MQISAARPLSLALALHKSDVFSQTVCLIVALRMLLFLMHGLLQGGVKQPFIENRLNIEADRLYLSSKM